MAATNLSHAAPGRPSPAQTSQPTQEQAHQEHPIGLYLKVWGLLFVLSAMSYAVDYFHVQGMLRWGLIVVLMLTKAGLIVAVFMHMAWERLALVCAILLPPLALLVLVGLMASEAGHTFLARLVMFP
jgi:cytochrome c oxidase subunit IV